MCVPEHVDDKVGCRVDGEHQVGDGHDLLDARVLVGARGLAHALIHNGKERESICRSLLYIFFGERLGVHSPP